jgi:hypothetical protein
MTGRPMAKYTGGTDEACALLPLPPPTSRLTALPYFRFSIGTKSRLTGPVKS